MTIINSMILGVFGWMISIYSFNIKTFDGNTISLEQYKDKKILLINIATHSPYAATQLPELEKFYQNHKDSIVVIGFPSNSFGNEPENNERLKKILQENYHLSFPIVEKAEVTGTDAHAIYKWLQSASDNEVTNATIKADFQKFLINRNGKLSGLFSSKTSVLGNAIQTAIQY